MQLSIAVILALGFADSATAFTPSSLLSCSSASRTKLYFQEGSDITEEAKAKTEAPPQPHEPPRPVFKDIKLRDGAIPEPNPLQSVNDRVQTFFGPVASPESFSMFGAPKTTEWKIAQNALVESMDLKQGIPNPDAYNFFGTDDHEQNLIHFVKSNPFFASALTEKGHNFELRAFDNKDPKADDKPTLFRKIMSSLGGYGHRVNVEFDSDLTKIKSIKVYDDITGDRIHKFSSRNEEEIRKWASSAIYNLLFYSSSIHGTIHVLHYLLTGALDYCSDDFKELQQWAKFYAGNVDSKYSQVSQQLILPPTPPQFLLQPPLSTSQGISLFGNWGLVSGASGFGARAQQINPVLDELLRTWFKNPSNFVEEMMNVSPERMESAGILTAFRKQCDLVKPFASKMSEAIKSIDNDRFTISELRTKLYLDRVGLESNVDSLEAWMHLMTVTGIMHGSTLSYSRCFSIPDIVRWRKFNQDVWEGGDFRLVNVGMATITGMEEHRHVFTPETDEKGESYAKEMADVLEEFSAKSDALKESHKDELLGDMDTFNKFGWILSDFCPDGFDGKQLTVATYI
jgi:hypothetical protein